MFRVIAKCSNIVDSSLPRVPLQVISLIALATAATAYFVPMQPAINPGYPGFHVIVPLQPHGFRPPSPYAFQPHGFHHDHHHHHHVHEPYTYPPPTTTTTIDPQTGSSGSATFEEEFQSNSNNTIEVVEEGGGAAVVEKTPEVIHKPNYEYEYKVNEKSTGDIKHHREKAVEGFVSGQYSLVEPDGLSKRIVDYTADDINGFQANVRREPYTQE